MDVYSQFILQVVLWVIGIGVAFTTSRWLYREMVGAKSERIRAANGSVHRALLRRMVLEGYQPKIKDITRILEGKAREHSVSVGDLMSEELVLYGLFTEVFDNDLIDPDSRTNLVSRLDALFEEARKGGAPEDTVSIKAKRPPQALWLSRAWLAALLVLPASGVGAFLVATIGLRGGLPLEEAIRQAAGIFAVSVAIIAMYLTIIRYRQPFEQPSRVSQRQQEAELEGKVIKALEELGVEYQPGEVGGTEIADIIAHVGGQKVAVQIKPWLSGATMGDITRTVAWLRKMMEQAYAWQDFHLVKGIVVTEDTGKLPAGALKSSDIEIVSISQLKQHLRNMISAAEAPEDSVEDSRDGE